MLFKHSPNQAVDIVIGHLIQSGITSYDPIETFTSFKFNDENSTDEVFRAIQQVTMDDIINIEDTIDMLIWSEVSPEFPELMCIYLATDEQKEVVQSYKAMKLMEEAA